MLAAPLAVRLPVRLLLHSCRRSSRALALPLSFARTLHCMPAPSLRILDVRSKLHTATNLIMLSTTAPLHSASSRSTLELSIEPTRTRRKAKRLKS